MENVSIKIATSVLDGTKSGLVYLEGNLSTQNNKKIKDKILQVLSDHDQVKVIMRNVTDIDLNVFQLFYSLKKLNPHLIKNLEYEANNNVCHRINSKGILGVLELYNN